MQPINRDVRTALLAAHTDLTEGHIDELQELLALRFSLDAEREADRVRVVDGEVRDHVNRWMPRYAEVLEALASRRHR